MLLKLVVYGADNTTVPTVFAELAASVGLTARQAEDGHTQVLELTMGEVAGWRTDVMVQTAPAGDHAPGPRLLVLKGADGVIFAQGADMAANGRSAEELREGLDMFGIAWPTFPVAVVAPTGSAPVAGLEDRPTVEPATTALKLLMKAILTALKQR